MCFLKIKLTTQQNWLITCYIIDLTEYLNKCRKVIIFTAN
jgi:hypothetical protein